MPARRVPPAADAAGSPRLPRLSDAWTLGRPFTWLAPVVGVLAGAGVAAAALSLRWARPVLLPAAGAAILATAASNAWNQVFDVQIDRVNKPDRPLPAGRMGRPAALALGHGAALLALLLAALVSPAYLGCIAIGLLATWVYSAPPLRWKRRTVAALLAIALPRGLLVPVAGWAVLAAPGRPDPWALGVVAGLFVLGAAATKDFADAPGDRTGGCRTLPLVLGHRRAAIVVAPFLVLPFVLYPVFGYLGLLAAPVSRLAVLAGVLVVAGVWTAWQLLRDPEGGRVEAGRSHPAWWGMYFLLIGMQAGALLVYL